MKKGDSGDSFFWTTVYIPQPHSSSQLQLQFSIGLIPIQAALQTTGATNIMVSRDFCVFKISVFEHGAHISTENWQ